ncbi:acyl-CoA dehydrogenase family protein [Bacillus benzoevorans]|uniref:Dibenzothiophene monooxygenase n=1 Tax=Bacillus benzoevorans TaxID=1456 RepID=A0A7X0LUB4_9BACI|nr:acyl-CoA dehydrogenase family protein [Bacillus benzoevorans]MBB6444265.1 alkylation response protein AidB-like acyl-CoA dehydrogenase [Bacillus benzoevorans]
MTAALDTKKDYLNVVRQLTKELEITAVERDKRGGTAKTERDLIRQSGLLALITSKSLGGYGENWRTVLQLTREIAKVDGSMAHLFGYHFLCLKSVHLYGSPELAAKYEKETVDNNLFWGNAFNPRDENVVVQQVGNQWVVNGKKSFCSGAKDSDRLLISAKNLEKETPFIAVIPTNRRGIVVKDDWDSFGQRQTDSGTVIFQNVLIEKDEVLDFYEQEQKSFFPTIRTHTAQSILTHVLLGVSEGAFDAAKEYTKTTTRPWITSGAETAASDPYNLHHYGELFVQLQAASALADRAAESLQNAWNKERAITEEERGECGITVAAAKVITAKTALEVTSRVFEVMGARATAGKYRFDRFWRNVRTHTLHDPIDYKIRDIGNWVLNEQLPEITPYS